MSNPNFEFWLLLHFDEVLGIDREKLLENPKIDKKKRFVVVELCKLVPGYRKNKIMFSEFLCRIDNAIQNEKQFTETLVELKTQIGSNIGLLIQEIKA